MSLRFLDTNILLYAVSIDPAEQDKRRIAKALLAPLDWCCSAQVLQEFYTNAIKSTRGGIASDQARDLVERFAACARVATDVALVQRGIELSQRYQISYWDGAIIAAAQRCGADELLTEDLNAGPVIEGVRVVNPFGNGAIMAR
jgi:predicted nucleic acid-binding protein